MPALVFSLLLGTPVLSLVGAIGVSLTVAVNRGGVLLSLIILPLYIPVLIFGARAADLAAEAAARSRWPSRPRNGGGQGERSR